MRYFIIWPGYEHAESDEPSWIAAEFSQWSDADEFTTSVGGQLATKDHLERHPELLERWNSGDDRVAITGRAREILKSASSDVHDLHSSLNWPGPEDWEGYDDDIYCQALIQLRAIAQKAVEVMRRIDEPVLVP